MIPIPLEDKFACEADNASHFPSCPQNTCSGHDEYDHMLEIRLIFIKISAIFMFQYGLAGLHAI